MPFKSEAEAKSVIDAFYTDTGPYIHIAQDNAVRFIPADDMPANVGIIHKYPDLVSCPTMNRPGWFSGSFNRVTCPNCLPDSKTVNEVLEEKGIDPFSGKEA